jgi:hypothetical protein
MRANRTWIVVAFAIAVVTLCCRDVLGRGVMRVEFKLLPPGHTLTMNDGTKVRYYKLNEFIELAAFDKELVKLRTDIQDLGDINNKLKIQMGGLERIIGTLESDKEILRERGLRLEGNWHEAEKELIEASGGPIWSYVVGAAGGVVGAVFLGMWVACKLSCN